MNPNEQRAFWQRNKMKGMVNVIDTSSLISLYTNYGFDKLEEKHDYLVFLRSEGYFSNVEILKLNSNVDISPISKGYSEIGYAVKVSNYTSFEKIHEQLFNGFFYQKNITNRLLAEYQEYATLQAKKLGCADYKFIPCKFIGDKNTIEKDAVGRIYQQLFQQGAQLIIVEAAAGFGKTSVSYELIRKLSEDSHGTVPIITELSKNRKASIFKYVLLTEIDAKFRGLSSTLVENEIRNGNVPLIIDGFDELLSKSISEDDVPTDDIETAQTMLSTIAQLLNENSDAKIVLTSRKSSILAGDLFAQWADTWLSNCEITRIQIVPPELSDWLTSSQMSVLKDNEVELDNIANPTLLTFLSSKSAEDIKNQFKTADDILNKYFQILLTREKDRQSLPLLPTEQLEIMESVAWNMVDLDITACSFEDFKVMLRLSIANEKINEYMERYKTYGAEIIPTEEEFIAKLAHHALLDRIPNTANLIGFINDFIFGYLIAQHILSSKDNTTRSFKFIKEKYWDLMITAFSVCSSEKRQELYDLFIQSGLKFSSIMQLNAEILLPRTISRKYCNEYFESFSFSNSVVIGSEIFENCTFSFCIFNNCSINNDAFINCKFYGCQFYDIKIKQIQIHDFHLIFSNCIGAESIKKATSHEPIVIPVNKDKEFERKVLEQYWRPGSEQADRRRLFNTLFRGFNQQDYSGITAAIERLTDRNILVQKNYCIELNLSSIKEIKEILGR